MLGFRWPLAARRGIPDFAKNASTRVINVGYIDPWLAVRVVRDAVFRLDYPVIRAGTETSTEGIAHRGAIRGEQLGLVFDRAVDR